MFAISGHQISDLLKGNKTDADRQENTAERIILAQEMIQRSNGKIGIFEIEEKQDIDKDGNTQKNFFPGQMPTQKQESIVTEQTEPKKQKRLGIGIPIKKNTARKQDDFAESEIDFVGKKV